MNMSKNTTRSFWIQVSLASLTGILLAVTLISREWIELVFGVDPDGGSGAVEWAIVATLFLATISFALFARFEWVRVQSSAR